MIIHVTMIDMNESDRHRGPSSRSVKVAVLAGASVALLALAGCGSTSESVIGQQPNSAVPVSQVTLTDGSVVTAGEGTTIELNSLGEATGTNGQERITINGTGRHVDSVVAKNTGAGYNGHHHIYSNNGEIEKNQSNNNPIITLTKSVGKKLTNHTQVCAEGWRFNGGSNYTLMGRPCLIVTN